MSYFGAIKALFRRNDGAATEVAASDGDFGTPAIDANGRVFVRGNADGADNSDNVSVVHDGSLTVDGTVNFSERNFFIGEQSGTITGADESVNLGNAADGVVFSLAGTWDGTLAAQVHIGGVWHDVAMALITDVTAGAAPADLNSEGAYMLNFDAYFSTFRIYSVAWTSGSVDVYVRGRQGS